MPDTPPGFAPFERSSPFLDAVGPLHVREAEDGDLVFGLRIAAHHVNNRGTAHGGLLLTLADIALGYNVARRAGPQISLVTANLTADFAGAAHLGDWVEARVDVQKIGGRLAFANAYLAVGDSRIARASAVFSAARRDAP